MRPTTQTLADINWFDVRVLNSRDYDAFGQRRVTDMGRIHGYPFLWVLFVGTNQEVPEFDDDTAVVVVQDDDPRAGSIITLDEYNASQENKKNK